MATYPVISLMDRFSSLQTMGLAVKYFPGYVNRRLHLHAVDVVLMSVILRGRGQHVMGDRSYAENRGSVGITHYGQAHDILTTAAGMDIYNVYLDLRGHALPQLPEQFQPVLPVILPLHPRLGNRLNRSVHFSVRQPQRLAELLRRIERELDERPPGYEEGVRLCFRLFLIDCCREALHGGIVLSPSDGPRYPPRLDRLRQELDRSFARPVELEDLAELVGVSKGHLCRLFKSYTGKTIFEYLIEKRIQAAMLRLQSSDEKVLTIALECGFNDITYFNRTFRRLTGQSPRQYRLAIGRVG